MLLSRIAETMFWLGRYVERAEDLARIIVAHGQLNLDMPKDTTTWQPVIELCGAGARLGQGRAPSSVSEVVGALVNDRDNPASIYRILHNAKEDLRLSRPLLPKESWQVLSRTCQLLETLPTLAPLTDTSRALDRVIQQCQQFTGQVDGCMSRDEAFSFLTMGRLLERADITLRVVVMLADVLTHKSPALPFANIRWLGALKYVAADQMFLRRYHARTDRSVAVKFLLFDRWFPRSVNHCLVCIESELDALPNSVEPLEACRACFQTQSLVDALDEAGTFAEQGLQLLAAMSNAVEQTYFHALISSTPYPE